MIGGCSRNPQPPNQGTKTELQFTVIVVVRASRKASRPHRLLVNPSHTQLHRTSKSKSTRARDRPEHPVCAEHHYTDLAASDGLPRRDHVLCRHRSPTQLELYVLTKQPATLEVSVRQLTGVASPIQPTANVSFHPKCVVNNNFRSCQRCSTKRLYFFQLTV